MQLENCCYGETELLALNLCRKGVLGDLMYGEAAYVHDLSGQALSKEGDVEWWRLDWNAQHKGNQYPTHGLGPVCQYLGINRGDQFDHLVSMENRQARMTLRAEAKKAGRFLGKEIAMADMNTTLIRTKLGRMILLAHDVSSPRPYTRYNTIQGTKMSVTVPTVLPIAVGTDGTVSTATDAKIVNNSFGAVKVNSVSIEAAQGWSLAAFGDKATLAHEKVNSNKFGFSLCLGDGEKKMTDDKNASKQTLLTDAINGCFMSGVGDTSANSIGIAYDANVTPVSEAVTTPSRTFCC